MIYGACYRFHKTNIGLCSLISLYLVFTRFLPYLTNLKLTKIFGFVHYSYFSEVSSWSYLSEALLHSWYLLEYLKTVTGSTAFLYLGTLDGQLQCTFLACSNSENFSNTEEPSLSASSLSISAMRIKQIKSSTDFHECCKGTIHKWENWFSILKRI